MKKIALLICAGLSLANVYSQNVGIGTTSPGAKLEISSTNSGILIPRVSLTGTNDVTTVPSHPTSTMIYNTNTVGGVNAVSPGYYYWNGSLWNRIVDVAAASALTVSGDVTGSLSAVTVTGIQGRPVTSTAPASNQVLTYNGASWVPATPTTGTVTSVTGTAPISVANGTTTPAISLGVVPIANGGTNSTATPTGGGIGYGTGTAHAYTAAGTSGQVLTSGGAGAPTWTTPTAGTVTAVTASNGLNIGGTGSTSATPNVQLGGALTGTTTITQGANAFNLANDAGSTGAINIGTGSVANGSQRIINIGNGGVTNTTLTNILSSVSGSVTVNHNGGGTTYINGGSNAGTLYLGNSTANNINVPGFTTAGLLHNDASGNVTSGKVSLTSDVSGILPVANGGTGSSTQGWVDLSTNQTAGGNKTWTGIGTFTPSGGGSASAVIAAAASPAIAWDATGQATDQKWWDMVASGTTLLARAVNDANSAATVWMQANRGSGTAVSSVYFPNSSVTVNTTSVLGNFTVNNASTTTASSPNSYALGVSRASSNDLTLGSDASFAYAQSWNNKPLLINGQGNIVGIGTTTTPNGLLELKKTTQLQSNLVLSGQEYYQTGNTATGIAIMAGVNRTGNKQLWITDQDAVATQNTTNTVVRINPNGPSIDALATDGVTTKNLTLGSGTGLLTIPSLSTSSEVYTDASKNLTSTPPTSGNLGYWTRNSGSGYLYNTTLADKVGVGIAAPLFTLSTSNSGTIATSILRLQNSYLDNAGLYGIQLAGIDNGSNGHDLRIQGRTTSNGAFSDLVTFKNSGNVGVNNTNPLNLFDIQGPVARTGTHATGRSLYVTGTFSSGASGAEFRHDNGTQGVGIGYNTIYATGSNANQDLGIQSHGTGNLNFYTNDGTQRAIILSSGNMGIGTTSPTLALDVLSTIGLRNGAAWDHMYLSHDGSTAYIRAGGAEANGLALQVSSNNSLAYGAQTYSNVMNLTSDGIVHVGDATNATSPYILPTSGTTLRLGNSSLPLQDIFNNYSYVKNWVAIGKSFGGSASAALDAEGNTNGSGTVVGADGYIGYFTNAGTSTSGAILTNVSSNVNGCRYIEFEVNGSETGCLYGNGSNVTSLYSASDGRLKTDIKTTNLGINNIMQIPVRDYTWKEDGKKVSAGFIAQELYKVYPDAVLKGSDEGQEVDRKKGGMWMVNYAALTPLLVKAVQDQQAEIERLKEENKTLQEAKADATDTQQLKARLEALEQIIGAKAQK